MAVTSPQTFGKDYILDKLIAHFNSQSAASRTIKSNDLPLYNIKVVSDGEGQPTIVVGDESANYPASSYIGEATYTWVGPRNTPTTATAAHFYEIAKYVNSAGSGSAINIRVNAGTYIGTLEQPQSFPVPPQTGEYSYMLAFRSEGEGWMGDTVELQVDGQYYTFEPTVNDVFEVPFKADAGMYIGLSFQDNYGSGNASFVLFQYDETNGPWSGTDIPIYPLDSTTFTYPTNYNLAGFNAPFVPVRFDMSQNSKHPLMSGGSGYGISMVIDAARTRLAIRDNDGAGTTQFFNTSNAEFGGQPSLSWTGQQYGGYDEYLGMSANGEYFSQASGGFAPKIMKYNPAGPTWVDDNSPYSGSSVRRTLVEQRVGGLPTVVVAGSSPNAILVYERDGGGTWTVSKTIPAPGNTGTFGNVMTISRDTRTIIAANNSGGLYMYNLTGDDWATGSYTLTDISSYLQWYDSPANVGGLMLNAAGDLAIIQDYYAPGTNEWTGQFDVYENVIVNGDSATRIVDLLLTGNNFSNLQHCDHAYNPNEINPGFVATTRLNDARNVIIWVSPDANCTTREWTGTTSTPENIVLMPGPDGLQSTNTLDITGVVPYMVSESSTSFLVGDAQDQNTVYYMEFVA